MPRALVRPPSPRLAEGLLTHLDRQPVDVELAQRQWDAYVEALAAAGFTPIEVPAAPDHPDSVFVEDTVVMTGATTGVLTRPGATERRGEVAGVAEVLRDLGYELTEIDSPATLDGGDVLKVGSRMYVGLGGRTTADACDQLARLTEADVVGVPVDSVLHLKSAVTALPDGTVIGYPPIVDHPEAFDDFLPVPEEPGSHVVVLDDDTVLMAASAPASTALFRDRGLTVVTVDISEFEKLEGCVTCLSVRLRD